MDFCQDLDFWMIDDIYLEVREDNVDMLNNLWQAIRGSCATIVGRDGKLQNMYLKKV